MGKYYGKLKKPDLAPPGSVFGPVWTALYTIIGVAAWLVWRRTRETGEGRKALGMFGVQLVLNAAWTPVFFGLRSPGGGLAVIAALNVAILGTLLLFFPISLVAGLLLLPYMAWVGFASYLNFSIWREN